MDTIKIYWVEGREDMDGVNAELETLNVCDIEIKTVKVPNKGEVAVVIVRYAKTLEPA